MTRFFYKGKSLYRWCKENNVLYHNAYRRMDVGMKAEQAIQDSIKIMNKEGSHRSHPRLFYEGKSLVEILTPTSYRTLIKRKNKGKGMSLEEAIKKGHLFRKDGTCL